jgi:hypothetical protein
MIHPNLPFSHSSVFSSTWDARSLQFLESSCQIVNDVIQHERRGARIEVLAAC